MLWLEFSSVQDFARLVLYRVMQLVLGCKIINRLWSLKNPWLIAPAANF